MGSIFRKMERQSLRTQYAELTKQYNNARRNDPNKFIGKRKISFGMFIKNYATMVEEAIAKAKQNHVTAVGQENAPMVPMKVEEKIPDLEWKQD